MGEKMNKIKYYTMNELLNHKRKYSYREFTARNWSIETDALWTLSIPVFGWIVGIIVFQFICPIVYLIYISKRTHNRTYMNYDKENKKM